MTLAQLPIAFDNLVNVARLYPLVLEFYMQEDIRLGLYRLNDRVGRRCDG